MFDLMLSMTLGDMLFELILAFLGAYFGVLIALWYEGHRRPRLMIEMHDRAISYHPKRRAKVCFLHLAVRNVPRIRCSVFGRQVNLPFLEPDTAFACEGTITFFTGDGKRLHDRNLSIRWVGNPEPLKFELDPQGERVWLPEPLLEHISLTTNIAPDKAAPLDIAVREDDDPNAYGWNHESYIHNWKHPDFVIPQGRYIIEARIQSGSQQAFGRFYLINGPTIEEFVIKPFAMHCHRT